MSETAVTGSHNRNMSETSVMGSHNRNMSEASVMDRGRPVRRTSKRQRSRTCSEANTPDVPVDNWTLTTGMPVSEASRRMNDADKQQLHRQAYVQAEKFEVLKKRDVSSMSRVSNLG
jgi:hypothetical protein